MLVWTVTSTRARVPYRLDAATTGNRHPGHWAMQGRRLQEGARPSRLSVAADMKPDMAAIARLIPGVDIAEIKEASAAEALVAEMEGADD